MSQIFIIPTFAALIAITWLRIRSIDFKSLSFIDGILFGAIFYLIIPFFFMLIIGDNNAGGFRAPIYNPFRDVETTINILLGIALLLGLHFVLKLKPIRPSESPDTQRDRRNFSLFVALFLTCSFASFLFSGKASGGHWADRAHEQLSSNTAFVIVGNLSNAYRAMVFGFIVYLVERKAIPIFIAMALGAGFVILDTAITFNRVTAAYYAVAVVIMLRRHLIATIATIAILAEPVAYISSAWTMFRSLALKNGFNFASASDAFRMASINTQARGHDASALLNSIFESSNIVIYNFIVQSFPSRIPLLWGETFLLRPLTIFVPGTIWPDKPPVFGTLLGYYVQNIAGLPLNSTLFGEAFGNFYYLWPLALGAALSIFHIIFSKLAGRSPYFGFFGCFVGIALWRFDMSFAASSALAIIVFAAASKTLSANPNAS